MHFLFYNADSVCMWSAGLNREKNCTPNLLCYFIYITCVLQVFLGWPTSIAFSPVDGSLHILDSSTNLILKVTPENKVAIVAGRPSHCPEVLYKKAGLGLLGKI